LETDVDDQATKIHLIASDDAEPRVKLAAGKRYDVVVTSIVDHDFNEVAADAKDPQLRPARLCGSRSTCLAIVETGPLDVD
jgi:hypothetical protein